ncbi:hypothetical protein GCM10007857_90140 [Bradyrhizobium iriomotense]|uniref:Uncharacterized protein n=1 Tax=Bradyrhizobium iriomotense TaxID=441950 RepID=A0ABQ6BHA2_9BRAD|nr:hypothetical protein [Bradyrhizobium iriomotense]GLR92290.1 hypothetical protein GCM10007857_90140 [Bradyrhizobium iriomotense]
MIKAELVLSSFEAVFDGLAMAFHRTSFCMDAPLGNDQIESVFGNFASDCRWTKRAGVGSPSYALCGSLFLMIAAGRHNVCHVGEAIIGAADRARNYLASGSLAAALLRKPHARMYL